MQYMTSEYNIILKSKWPTAKYANTGRQSPCNSNVRSETVTVEDPNPSLHRCGAVRFGDLTLQNAGK